MNKAVTSFAKTFLAVFFMAMLSVSCSEDDVIPTSIDDLGEVRLNFKYNGVTYTTDPTTFNLTNKTVDGIYGSGSNMKRITLFMPLTPTVGTHFVTADPSNDSAYGAYFISNSNSVDMLADSGLITITHVTDDYVKGTFYFSGPNGPVTVSVTEGEFLADR